MAKRSKFVNQEPKQDFIAPAIVDSIPIKKVEGKIKCKVLRSFIEGISLYLINEVIELEPNVFESYLKSGHIERI